ncbi:MAG TPA: DNA ligase D [Terracidiphilus sp.]|jgi:bifunctional non-homologous end joining protein LigD
MAARAQSRSKAARTVQRQLERYRAMRDFHVTAEPRGNGKASAPSSAAKLPFVVQKHAATRLHYDFRLGWHGVLKSWAVTKGPSYNPSDKRLAVQVEDHPMEYGGFEGAIPKGQYGGGTVMVWDFGEWTPLDDVDSGLAKGHLKFELNGKKLHGRWALVRMHGHGERPDKPNWLLIKDRDEFARQDSESAITDELPDSAMTGRSIEQIAESADTVWDSKNGLRGATAAKKSAKTKTTPAARNGSAGKAHQSSRLRKTRKAVEASGPREAFPGFIPPQLAQQSETAPNGPGWIHELKLDGYRIQIHIRSRKLRSGTQREATLLTRKGLDWTKRMPDIAHAASELPVDDAILDGEVVALNDKGIASFADLQAAFQEGQQKFLVYFAFDLLHLNGRNTRELPLTERKELLAQLLAQSKDNSLLRFSEHFLENGPDVFAHACRLGAEGIVSKLAAQKYAPGHGNAWLKTKCVQEQELVIGGFTLPSKGGHGIGALLLGYYQDGKLIYAGRSGTGFTDRARRTLRTQLDRLLQKNSSFAQLPSGAGRGAKWVKPELVAQIAFATWTRDNLVRQASFRGLREDKPAREVEREVPAAPQPTPRKSSPHKSAVKGKRAAPLRRENRKDSTVAAQFHISHPDRVLDPASGMTKLMLAEYYLGVAERMLPHVADRPLSVVRCPEGSDKPCFFQKHVGRGLPPGVNSIPVRNRKTGVKEEFLTLDSAEGLAGMAQMGVLEIHPWGSRNETLDQPDRIIFDLDPDAAVEWSTLTESATDLRKRLKKLNLTSFLKSTGGKGLHVVVPIEPEHEWPVIKKFAHEVVLRMEAEQPMLYLTKMSKAERKNRIFLDYLRNDREATAIAPFSPRARNGAPVAMTLGWNELKLASAPKYRVADFKEWRSRLTRDPWKEMAETSQRLTEELLAAVSASETKRSHRP